MPTFTSLVPVFENMCEIFKADKAGSDKATIQFDFAGDNGGKYWVKVESGACQTGTGDAPGAADMTLLCSGDDWLSVVNGQLNPMTALMQGKIKVQGNMGFAMKLQQWFPMG